MTDQEDQDIRGDREVSDLWCEHYARVVRYLTGQGASRELSEEIAADAFLAARVAWKTVGAYEKPMAFVFKVATIELRRRWLKENGWRAQLTSALPDLPDDGVRVDALSLATAVKADVQAALARLPPRCREVLLLRHYGDFSMAETAAILGLSEGATKGYASEGRTRLSALLADYRDAGTEDR